LRRGKRELSSVLSHMDEDFVGDVPVQLLDGDVHFKDCVQKTQDQFHIEDRGVVLIMSSCDFIGCTGLAVIMFLVLTR
jgi:hypothetical protein